jgi:hypothetical protein
MDALLPLIAPTSVSPKSMATRSESELHQLLYLPGLKADAVRLVRQL